MLNITCTNNTAVNDGGCIAISDMRVASIVGGTFNFNGLSVAAVPAFAIPTRRGGAIFYKTSSFVGGIDNDAALKIESSTFEENDAEFDGGALYVLDVFNIEIKNGTAFNKNNSNGRGGAIFADFSKRDLASKPENKPGGFVKMHDNVSFIENVANGDGGALYLGKHLRKLTCKSNGTKFENNSSQGNGGAIFAGFKAPTVGPDTSYMWLSASTEFRKNRAEGVGLGGAVYIDPPPVIVELVGQFYSNTAHAGGGGIAFAATKPITRFVTEKETVFNGNKVQNGFGGGLLVDSPITAKDPLKGIYQGNKASKRGGGAALRGALPALIFEVENANFLGNTADDHDPAIYIANVPAEGLQFTNVNFTNHTRSSPGCGGVLDLSTANIATLSFTKGEVKGNKTTAGDGGAFCVGSISTSLDVDGTGVDGNSAVGGDGGFIHVAGAPAGLNVTISNNAKIKRNSATRGGAFNLPSFGSLTIQAAEFAANKASNGNGGVFNINSVSDVFVYDASFRNNGAGNALLGNVGNGGVFAINRVGNFSMGQSATLLGMYRTLLDRFDGNHQGPPVGDERAIVSMNNTAHGNGGAVWLNRVDGDVGIHNQLWFNNVATSGSGGFIFVDTAGVVPPSPSKVALSNSIFYKNRATAHGGVASIVGVKAVAVEAFEDVDGTAPFVVEAAAPPYRQIAGPAARLGGTDFVAEIPQVFAGELPFSSLDDLYVKKGGYYRAMAQPNYYTNNFRGFFLFDSNSANGYGGALYIDAVEKVTVKNMSFTNNQAANGVGGTLSVTNLRDSFDITSSIIFGGKARDNAGAVFVTGGPLGPRAFQLSSSSIQSSEVNGGATIFGSAGVFLTNMNSISLTASNFFDNEVKQALPMSTWAASLYFKDRPLGPLPAINPLYNPAVQLAAANWPLANPVDLIPVLVKGPIEIRDNKVIGSNIAATTGAILVPAAISVGNYYNYGPAGNVFHTSGNSPRPVDNATPNQAVVGN